MHHLKCRTFDEVVNSDELQYTMLADIFEVFFRFLIDVTEI